MTYVAKNKNDILRQALQKLQTTTPITSIGPGSVARALTESVTNEIGDFYNILDYNMAQTVISTASGRALDLMGQLYGVTRNELGTIATIDQSVGSFYFYLDSPHTSDVVIPEGTRITTGDGTFIGDTFSYLTTAPVTIPAGRTRAFVSLRPEFGDSVFTAGANTLINHNFPQPSGTTVRCTNPKAIAAQAGYESDANYRLRIIKTVRTTAGGTAEAVRFAGLSVAGIRDVKVRQAPYGLGTFEALVVPEDRSNVAQTIVNVATELDKVRPVGVRMFVREPDYLAAEIHATIVLRKDVNVSAEGMARRAEIAALRYLNTLLPGHTLMYNQLIQQMMDASDTIRDVVITRFRVDGTEVLRRNYSPAEDQQVVPGEIRISTS